MHDVGSVAAVPRLQSTGSVMRCLAALQHVGSSQTRDRTHVPCIGRQILTHFATREVLRENLSAYFTLDAENMRMTKV